MKMRESFQKETAEIIRIMSLYKTLMYNQIIRIFPGRNGVTEKIIERLLNQKRIIYDEETAMLYCGQEADANPDMNLITAFWVLADFYDTVEFHSPTDYPAQIAFFMDAELYEIIKADYGRETVINHVLSGSKQEKPNRIIIADSAEQIPKIKADNIFCFCTVDKTGVVEYFNFE